MDIYTKEGGKVIFLHNYCWFDFEQKMANKYLKLWWVYTVKKTKVGSCHTLVYLKEFPDKLFNSVMFENISNKEYNLFRKKKTKQNPRTLYRREGFWWKWYSRIVQ